MDVQAHMLVPAIIALSQMFFLQALGQIVKVKKTSL